MQSGSEAAWHPDVCAPGPRRDRSDPVAASTQSARFVSPTTMPWMKRRGGLTAGRLRESSAPFGIGR
jgi:hypothetical protein